MKRKLPQPKLHLYNFGSYWSLSLNKLYTALLLTFKPFPGCNNFLRTRPTIKIQNMMYRSYLKYFQSQMFYNYLEKKIL